MKIYKILYKRDFFNYLKVLKRNQQVLNLKLMMNLLSMKL